MPACNGRFGKIAALTPQKRQCEIGNYYPAASVVEVGAANRATDRQMIRDNLSL